MTGDFAAKLWRNYFATKLFNFHMNSFDMIIENKADFFIIKRKDITFKNVTKSNWELEQEAQVTYVSWNQTSTKSV